jgi:hypothetical protein
VLSTHSPTTHSAIHKKSLPEKKPKKSESETQYLSNEIKEIVHLEANLGFQSTFFIPTFQFNLNEIRDTLKVLQKSGTEIQLYYIHEDHPQQKGFFAMQKEYFNHIIGPVHGVRCHNLWITPPLLVLFEEGRIYYDSSYRGETVETVEPFLHETGLVEIPIGLMDMDLFQQRHLTEKEAWKYLIWDLKLTEAHRATYYTYVFHPEPFNKKSGRLYKKFLKYLADEGYESIRCCDLPLVKEALDE